MSVDSLPISHRNTSYRMHLEGRKAVCNKDLHLVSALTAVHYSILYSLCHSISLNRLFLIKRMLCKKLRVTVSKSASKRILFLHFWIPFFFATTFHIITPGKYIVMLNT